ncbi:MAG: sensor histidine kinase [Crocinitomicaceae bacterium]
MFLLPTVFILNATWKTWMLIFFNCTIILLTSALKIYLSNYSEIHPLDASSLEYISLINLTGTGTVLILIMVYFSRTISFKDNALIQVNAELEIQNKEIFEQYKHLQLLMKEMHHRVKNNLQIISSLMSLQERSVKDKDVIAVLNESKRRVEAIALIHQKLYQNENEYQVDFKSYLEEIMSNQQLINKKVRCKVKSEGIMLDLDTAVPLGIIISEMITNAHKHAYKNIEKPTLITTLSRVDDNYQIIIRDNGIGLPKDFNIYETKSLGFEIITALADQIEANIEFSNSPGAQFSIKFKNRTSIIA